MPRNGSGTYSLPAGNPVVSGTVIASSGWANPTLTDLASAITQSIASDGQTTPSANLPMGGFSHTGVGAATARTQYARAAEVQDGTPQWLTAVAGTNTITATAPLSVSAYVAGQTFRFVPANTTTGAASINLNGAGAKNIFYNGVATVGGELRAGIPSEVIYDGTQFHLQSLSTLPGLEFLGRLTGAGAGSLDIESQLNSAKYNGYVFVVEYLYPTTNASSLILRIRQSGTYATTNYVSQLGFVSSSSVGTYQGQADTNGIHLVATNSGSSTAANAWSGRIECPNAHTVINNITFTGSGSYTSSAATNVDTFVKGVRTAQATVEGFRFVASAGNITYGIDLFGIRKQ